jgi:alginate O-acetyltransferase complex protein AlgI
MVFSSTIFLVYFLPLVLGVYFILPKKLKNHFLLLASLFFYAWGEAVFCLIILVISVLNFYLVQKMNSFEQIKRKTLLILLIFLNLSVLLYFKYSNFILENLNFGLSRLNLDVITWKEIILPIGISFYTFQTLTYIIDVYRKETKLQEELHLYLLYIFLFPQLIAGPIVKYNSIVGQLKTRIENSSDFIQGFIRFSVGLAKKVLIANVLGAFTKTLLYPEIVETISSSSVWLGMLCYTFQIYFDFSAYSDMAIGLGKMFGFSLPENFNRPYTSYSISQFWRKWHITLGDFMKNYLYIPLGGNKVSKLKIYRNLILVFLLSGFWHGDNWTFIIWGLFHGFWMVLDRLFLEKLLEKIKFLSIPFTFLLVLLSWVFFQAENLDLAFNQFTLLFQFNFQSLPEINFLFYYFFHLILAILICVFGFFNFAQSFSDKFLYANSFSFNLSLRVAVSVVLFTISLSEILGSSFNPFIYFKF